MIREFKGECRFLSNFYESPVEVFGEVYPTVEHAYQALKCVESRERKRVMLAGTPREAKRLGRRVMMRADWDSVKVEVMRWLLRIKFNQGELKWRLLGTGNKELVEGNSWGDKFWGVCGGEGQNLLGKLLMETREWLRKEERVVKVVTSYVSKVKELKAAGFEVVVIMRRPFKGL